MNLGCCYTRIMQEEMDLLLTVVISSDDTDVFLLALAFKRFVPSSVYIKHGTQARNEVHWQLACCPAPWFRGVLMSFWTTRFYWLWHCNCLLWKRESVCIEVDEATREIARALPICGYTAWDASDELFSRLQEFTCFTCSSSPETKLTCGTVSSGPRWDLDFNQLPPTEWGARARRCVGVVIVPL